MFRTIITKELLDAARSMRFALGWLVMLVLMVAAVVLLSDDVRQRQDRMELIERSQDEYVSHYAHLNRIGYVLQPVKPPEKSEVFFRGLDDPAETQSFFSDPLGKLFPRLDFIYIVSVLLSLLAIIFSFDAVCGEREDGTLKVIHANPVSRASVILGKWVGMWLAIGIPFIAVYFFSVLVGSLIAGVSVGPERWLELGLICAASLVYLGFFLCLGLFVSSTVRQPGTSILVLLFLWVVFTMVVPNGSPVAASQIKPLPSVNAVEREASALTDTIRDNLVDAERDRIWQIYRERYSIPPTINDFNKEEDFLAAGWTAEQYKRFYDTYVEEIRAALNAVNERQSAKAQALRDELQRKVDAQSGLAMAISLASPTSSYVYFGTELASVGLRAEEHTREEMSRFGSVQDDFLQERWHSEEQRQGRKIGYEEFIDLSGRPRYSHKPEPVMDRLAAALPFAGHLVAAMLLAVILAVIAYLRYDVR
jgi:ABC-type transport system involved in multi-copper enzyme maturation permease subunit